MNLDPLVVQHHPMESLKVYLAHPRAILPQRANATDAGMDISSIEDVVIPKGGRALVDTGIKVVVPNGYYLRVAPRSGLAVKHGIHVGAGVVDEGYTGIVKVLLFNMGDDDFGVTSGTRIAQLILEKISLGPVEQIFEMPNTDRGAGGFGSTGL